VIALRFSPLALLVACAAAPPPVERAEEAPRYSELVATRVLRDCSGEPEAAIDHAREVAVYEAATNLDALRATEVEGFRLDVSLTLVSESPGQIQVRALVAVHTVGPPEQMRAMLQGTGTVQRGTDRDADLRLAAEGAVRAALRRLPQIAERFS